MRRSLALLAGVLFVVATARGDDGIPAETVAAVKRATVLIRVQKVESRGSGSGFVIAAEKDTVLIATNYHVVGPSDFDKKPRLAPAALVKSLKVPTVSVVFDGGTKTELTVKADVIAADPVNDLAVLRVTGLKELPKPIAYTNPPKLAETMAVYTFGYPFGQALATGKGAPAVTVGKASVSSLRTDEDGELSSVQIDGALNPGNSGGPIVDTKGQLVGVAVQTITGSGIGFGVPAQELGKLMKGRLDGFQMTGTKTADGKLTVTTEVGVLDPTGAVRTATLHYVVVPPKGAKPKAGDPIAKMPGAKSVPLKIANGVATGELTVETAAGDLYVQAVPDGAGAAGTSRVGSCSLAVPKTATGAVVLGAAGAVPPGPGAGEVPAPAGWKVYTSESKAYICWVPEKVKKQAETARPANRRLNMSFNTLVVDAGDAAPTYVVEQVVLTSRPGREPDHDDLVALLRSAVLGEFPDTKLTRESDTTMGKHPGKEYLVESGRVAIRARTYVIGNSMYIVRVVGNREQVEGPDGTTFLDSVRLVDPNRPPIAGPVAGADTNRPPGTAPADPAPGASAGTIVGGAAGDKEFKDPVPAGGVLVGFDFGYAKTGVPFVVLSMRPVYLVGEKQVFGEWHGPVPDQRTTPQSRLTAKPGYAVTGVSVKTTPTGVGLAVTFTRLVDGKLDPKDSYQSLWVGVKDGEGAVTIGGKGELPLAFTGKANPTSVTGIGLQFGDGGDKKPDGGSPAAVGGASTDPLFTDPVPAGGTLIGLELGLGKLGSGTSVKGVRAIFRVGDKEVLGAWHGPIGPGAVTETVKVLAKPGYAIGGLKWRQGAGGMGLSVTFMKELKGKLDPSDSYESDWAGATVGSGPSKIGGTGELALGLAGRTNGDVLSAIGLLYPDTSKKTPDPKDPQTGIATAPPNPVRPTLRGPRLQGGLLDQEYRDYAPTKGVLVGFEFGVGTTAGKDGVKALRPIYRVGTEDSLGQAFGPDDANKADVTQVVKVVAKPGYAVGSVTVNTSIGIVGLSIKFMKVTDGKLDPKDSYESEWIGGKFGTPTRMGDGSPVVGVLVRANPRSVTGLGFVYPDTNKPGLDGAWPAGQPTRLHGGLGDPEFREAGPERALLVGFEFRVAPFVNASAVGAIRPIFRAAGDDTTGEWHGSTGADAVKVVARPGYAVGALSVKGQRVVEGFSVTFMKVVDGKLDPKDSYESAWLGAVGSGTPTKLGGDGAPVIGLVGKTRGDYLTGLGLLLPPAKK